MTRWHQFQKSAEPCFRFLKAEDLMHATHISLQHKYLYVETPKVACSTVKKILIDAEYGGRVENTEMEYYHYREFSPLLNARQVGPFDQFLARKDVFKFCFVRNPYTRLLSCYLDKIAKRKGQEYQLMIQLGYGPFSDKVLSFAEFVEGVIQQPVQYMDHHWRTQYYATFQEGIEYDFIGRFESIEDDLKNILGKINSNFMKYWGEESRHGTKSQNYIDEYYSDKLEQIVFEIYRKDFEYFGYKRL